MASSRTHCLFCGGAAGGIVFPYGTIWSGRRFDYVRCQGCGSSFVDPLPTEDDFARIYSHLEYHSEFYQEASEERSQSQLHSVVRFLKPNGRLLDFGCGSGSFLIAARNAGFQAEGVELEKQARLNAAAASGCLVHSPDEVRVAEQLYDVIHLGDVLEHLPAPERTMRQLETLMAPGGLFFLEGPLEDNASPVYYAARLFGWIKRLTGRGIYAELPPFHLIRTTARAQRSFLEQQLGYEILAFRVYESGWPYRNEGDRFLHPGSFARLIRMSIGVLAVAVAWVAAWSPWLPGNRFIAIARPKVRPGERS